MNATVDQITDKLKVLPQEILDQVLRFVESLDNAEPQEIPDWQQNIVAERLENYRHDSSDAIDADEVFKKIEKDM